MTPEFQMEGPSVCSVCSTEGGTDGGRVSGENARSLMRMQTNGRSAAAAAAPSFEHRRRRRRRTPSPLFFYSTPLSFFIRPSIKIPHSASILHAPPCVGSSFFFSGRVELYCVGWIPIPQLNNFHGGEWRGRQSVFHFFGPLLTPLAPIYSGEGDGVGVCRRPSPSRSRLSDHPPARFFATS